MRSNIGGGGCERYGVMGGIWRVLAGLRLRWCINDTACGCGTIAETTQRPSGNKTAVSLGMYIATK